jgi:hypothetical protein
MKKPANITCGSDRACRRPFEFEHQNRLIAHPTCPTQDGFDGRIDRLNDAEADGMVAVGRDPVDVFEQELAQPIHLRQPLPPQRIDPTVEEFNTPVRVLYVQRRSSCSRSTYAFEQPPIRGKQSLEFGAFRSAHRFPATQQQPAFAAAMFPHPRSGTEKFLATDLIERAASVLHHVEFVLW